MVDFKPVAGSTLKEYTANWDIVIGRTAQEMDDLRQSGVFADLSVA